MLLTLLPSVPSIYLSIYLYLYLCLYLNISLPKGGDSASFPVSYPPTYLLSIYIYLMPVCQPAIPFLCPGCPSSTFLLLHETAGHRKRKKGEISASIRSISCPILILLASYYIQVLYIRLSNNPWTLQSNRPSHRRLCLPSSPSSSPTVLLLLNILIVAVAVAVHSASPGCVQPPTPRDNSARRKGVQLLLYRTYTRPSLSQSSVLSSSPSTSGTNQ